jgi:hypothetical protein
MKHYSKVAMAACCALLASAGPANAVLEIDVGGNYYDVTTVTDTFNDQAATLESQPEWGNMSFAEAVATAVGLQLGNVNSSPNISGPLFAYTLDPSFFLYSGGAYIYSTWGDNAGPPGGLADIIGDPNAVETFGLLTSEPAPVPEPSTWIAGALLSVSFGRQGIRYLVRNRRLA